MGTVYHSILKGFNWILAGLLSLLGFSVTSCGATDEYGSPYAEYELKGKVTNMNGDPIQGIELNYGGIYNNVLFSSYISEMYKSPQTQKDGSYDIKFEDSPMGIVRIIAKDIDSFGSVRFVVMYPAVIAGAIAMSRPLSRICLSRTS